jgi:hypothetical protein
VTDFLDEWKWYLVPISALVVGLGALLDRRRGRASDLGGLRHVGEDLADERSPD